MNPETRQPSPPGAFTEGEFEFMTELCAVVAEQTELQPILDWIVSRATQLLGSDECTIKLVVPMSDKPGTVATDRRSPEAGAPSWPAAIKMAVMGYLMQPSSELVTPDIAEDARFPGLRGREASVRALLAVPLRVSGRVTGMFAASQAKPGRDWSRHDVQLLSILASHSAIVIEKARLRTEAEIKKRLELEREAIEKELRVAHDIQMRFVPETPLRLGPWDVDGRLVPARHVGGDFYDYFPLEGGRAALVIGDVAGKGVPAALLVSTVQSALRAYAGLQLEPLPLIQQLNRRVAQSVAAGRFVTLFYAEVDPANERMRYVNAGHVFPRVRRADGTMESIPAGGVPLGIFEDATFEQGECRLGPGDSVLMYSDGIPDAIDLFRHDFGEERIERLWMLHGADPAPTVLDRLLAAVAAFSGSAPQSDDQTLMVLSPAPRG